MKTNNYFPIEYKVNKFHYRHEHVLIACYLPEGTKIVLPNQKGFSELRLVNHSYCVKSWKEKRECHCQFAVDREKMQTAIFAKWNLHRLVKL